MFQENKPKNPKVPANIKDSANLYTLQDAATSQAVNQAGEKLQKVNKNITKVQAVAGTSQNVAGMFMNQSVQTNNPLTSNDQLWADQPTSKILNANAIPTSQILGINRLSNLISLFRVNKYSISNILNSIKAQLSIIALV